MNERLTPMQAWQDFLKEVLPGLKFKRIPNELHVAVLTAAGGVKGRNGKAKGLGAERIKRLLDKYAPGRYEFHEAHFVKC